jgi:hypothetical protein
MDNVYWIADAIFMAVIGAFMYYHSEKTGRNIAALVGILALSVCQASNRALILIDPALEIRHIDLLFAIVMVLDIIYAGIEKNYGEKIKSMYYKLIKLFSKP